MRPNLYDRRNQKSIRFCIDEEIKKSLKKYAVENDTSFQILFEEFAKHLLEKEGETK